MYFTITPLKRKQNKKISTMDGDLITYDVMSGGSNVTKNNFEEDNFYSADGTDDLFFSEARGKGRARRAAKKAARKDRRQGTILDKNERAVRRDRRGELIGSISRRQDERSVRKSSEADTQRELARSLSDPGVTQRSASQTNVDAAPIVTPTTGMSKNTMIALGIGAIVLIGGFYLMSKRGKSGK